MNREYRYGLGDQPRVIVSNLTVIDEEFTLNGAPLAAWISGDPNPVQWVHADQVGTERVRTNAAGAIVGSYQSLPFGDGYSSSGTDSDPLHFTGQHHDAMTGLEFFPARNYGHVSGAFYSPDASPDPAAEPYADFANPQSLNLYAYAGNNPVTNTDPDGHDFNLACSGSSDTCQGGIQGTTTYTTDANGNTTSSFAATVISGNIGNFNDQYGNSYSGTFNQNGVQFTDASGNAAAASFIGGSAANTITGSSLFAGFTGDFSGNCGSTCVASGTLNGTLGQFRSLKDQMQHNPGLDNVDFFHGTFFGIGPQNYRAGNPTGPDPHVVSSGSTERKGYDDFHYDGAYPYSSPGNFAAHTGSVLRTIWNWFAGSNQ